MRSLLIFLLLLPSVAHAEPVSSAIFTWLASSGVAVGTATAIASFVTRALTAVVTTLANQMLQKKVGINDRGIQTEQTTTGDVTPQKFVVGRYAVEGHAVAPAYSHGKNNRYLTYIIEVSNLPVVGLSERVAINGNWTAIDTTPANQHAEYGSPLTGLQNEGEDRGWIRFYDGTQATADAMLVDKYSTHPNRPWTTDHVLEGSAYAVLTFLFDREVFSGLPSVRFEIDGIRLYDPREDSTVGGSGVQRWSNPATWTFTKNPQVINYNILRGITLATGDVYGGQVPASDLPLDSWFAAMNECDELIGDRVQFEAGFEIDVSIEPLQIITEMNRASFAQISEFGGIFRPRVGAPASPVLSLTDGDILITRAADLTPFPGLAKTNNAITGTYVEPNDLYQGRSSDPIYNTTWEADDGGRRLTMDMGLPAVVNKSQCQHLLNSYVRDNRRFITHRLPLPPSFAALEPLDTISWTSAQNGYTSKVFEVVEIEDQLTTLVQMVVVREREAGDVAWSSGQDVPSPTDRTGIPTPDLIGVSLAVAEAVRFFRNEAQTVVVLTTSVTDDGVVDQIEVEYKRSADSDWIPLGRGGVGEFIVPDLIPATYDFRARPITTSGLPGPWDTETGFTVDFLEDYRSVWNGRFASGDFTGWQLEIYDGSLGGF
ncbi:Putative phage tail protein, partial [Thalassovita litoralis]